MRQQPELAQQSGCFSSRSKHFAQTSIIYWLAYG
jgi:hypothetical protein